MGKKHRNRWLPTGSPSAAAPGTPPQPSAPTPEQVTRLEQNESLGAELTAAHGEPVVEAASGAPTATLEELLRRVTDLLAKAKGHYDAAKTADGRLAEQKRDQEAAYAKLKKDNETQLEKRVHALDATEKDLKSRLADLPAREKAVTDDEVRLTERELNAEQGFRAERTRILGPLSEDVTRLKLERDELESALSARRAAAEESGRTEAEERAGRRAKEDEGRATAEAEARRALDEEMATARRATLAELRAALRADRATAEEGWETELAKRRAELADQAAALDQREAALAVSAREARGVKQELQAEQENLTDDRAALERKVQRLVEEGAEQLRHDAESLRKQLADARAQRDAYLETLDARKEADRRFRNQTPEQVVATLAALEKERDSLAAQLRERPDARAGERLALLERERSAWLEHRAVMDAELAKARSELATRRLAAIELETLRGQKEALEVHKQLLEGAVSELRARVQELTSQDDRGDPMKELTALDRSEVLQRADRTSAPLSTSTPTLRDFAEGLRHRIAKGIDGRTLYYSGRDVRSFLGGLAMTRLVLLQGISGTGKTSLPLAFASAVDGGHEIIEVQAGWRDRQDLIGYFNAFHRKYYSTKFLQALYKAGTPAYRDRLFMMVLDEINLSRPEQFFADFLSALEQPMSRRRIELVGETLSPAAELVKDGRHLAIPPNVWFVGTANHDESTTEFADKTYDRAHIMEMPRKTAAAHFDVQERGERRPISYQKLEAAFADAEMKHAGDARAAITWLHEGHVGPTLASRFGVSWGNRLEGQLQRYLPVVVEAGGTVGEAVDHMLATKVLRKLKDRHDVRVGALEELRKQLSSAWEALDKANPPERCLALIERELTTKRGEEVA